MENSTNAAPKPEKKTLPIDDGFYQLGYRHAIADVVQFVALFFVVYGVIRLVSLHEHD